MKKISVLFVLSLLGGILSAQNFRLGFQTSPHISWLNSSDGDIDNDGTRLGIRYGLDADIYIDENQRYALNTGLFVSNHSFRAIYTTEDEFFINDLPFDEPTKITYKTNYIEVPLNVKLRSDIFYRMTIYGQFGLSNLFNISTSATSVPEKLDGDAINNGLSDRTIRFYSLYMIMGGGVEYDVGGNTAINLGIQYSNGLTDVTKIESLDEKSVLNSMRLVIGVMF
ncbi:MAG: outer membrane beta-barrel protein [Prolixibacteraceae bacterium]|jgi:opacity protein-like surface antigen|nr:outer membrane beta-barrel protein [Prolixibacteraceae bacterium]